MIVEFAAIAEADLAELISYIAADNPARAVTFARELAARCLSLGENPHRFPEIRRKRAWSLRKLSHGNWLIFYIIRGDRVQIQRIVHGSRDWAALFAEFPQ